MSEIKRLLEESAKKTEEALVEYFGSLPDDLALIGEAEKYSLMGGGKRIRPFLTFEFCRMLGGTPEQAAPFAAAIEMIHTYSLIHDDLPCMDDDTYRRGRLTCHKKFDEATAILAGDALLTKAFGVAVGNPYVSSEQNVEAVALLAEAAGDGGMVGGQILDLSAEKNGADDIDQVLRLHSLKTGAMIRTAALLGCLAAGETRNSTMAQAADRYASGIGTAFQIVDDILDVNGDATTLGKATGADAKMNKVTFLNFFSVDEAHEYAARLTKEAVDALKGIPGNTVLCDLALYLLDRKN